MVAAVRETAWEGDGRRQRKGERSRGWGPPVFRPLWSCREVLQNGSQKFFTRCVYLTSLLYTNVLLMHVWASAPNIFVSRPLFTNAFHTPERIPWLIIAGLIKKLETSLSVMRGLLLVFKITIIWKRCFKTCIMQHVNTRGDGFPLDCLHDFEATRCAKASHNIFYMQPKLIYKQLKNLKF